MRQAERDRETQRDTVRDRQGEIQIKKTGRERRENERKKTGRDRQTDGQRGYRKRQRERERS